MFGTVWMRPIATISNVCINQTNRQTFICIRITFLPEKLSFIVPIFLSFLVMFYFQDFTHLHSLNIYLGFPFGIFQFLKRFLSFSFSHNMIKSWATQISIHSSNHFHEFVFIHLYKWKCVMPPTNLWINVFINDWSLFDFSVHFASTTNTCTELNLPILIFFFH